MSYQYCIFHCYNLKFGLVDVENFALLNSAQSSSAFLRCSFSEFGKNVARKRVFNLNFLSQYNNLWLDGPVEDTGSIHCIQASNRLSCK